YPTDVIGSTSSQSLRNDNGYASARQKLINGASSAQERAIYNALPSGSLPTDEGSTTQLPATSRLLRASGEIDPVATPANETNFGPTPSIGFNSAFAFDFDPSNGIDPSKMDFDAVATHEIGHALGFTSLANVTQNGAPNPTIWDLFRFRPGMTMDA